MLLRTRVSLILLVASAASTTAARAQGLYCKPLDKTGERLLYTAQRQATTPSDSAYRTKIWQIPLLTQSDIALVTDENVCEQAARAYDREMNPQTSTLTRGVYVIRLRVWYLVVDTESRAGEWMRGVVLDSAYAKHSNSIGL
ncbi:MAG TPA: hypothetical protein VN964_05105 [Gemmatimonadales bacterium]|nr:hypothetical protein [Gemmatimonadales bacterium]